MGCVDGGACNAPSQRGIKKFQPSKSTHLPLWPTMSAEWALRWPIHRAACNADVGPLMELLSTPGVEAGSGGPRAGAALPHIDALDEEGRWVFEFRPEPPGLEAAAAAHDRPPVSAHALLAVHTRYFCAQSENSLGLRVQVVRLADAGVWSSRYNILPLPPPSPPPSPQVCPALLRLERSAGHNRGPSCSWGGC